MPILIDGEPEWLIGYDNKMPDPSYYELYTAGIYGGPNSPEVEAARKASKIASWAIDDVRRANASKLMSELRKSGHVKPTYSRTKRQNQGMARTPSS